MSELKNTPWRANKRKEYPRGWEVKDKDGWTMGLMLTEFEAKSIASLPDTLAKLEAISESNMEILGEYQEALNQLSELKAENERLKLEVDSVQHHNNLAVAELEELKADLEYLKTGISLEISARERLEAELERVKKERKQLKQAAQAVLDNWESGDGKVRVADIMNDLKKAIKS